MAELEDERGYKVKRVWEQPPDAISLYSDVAQVLSTGNEVMLQFYETIPEPPGAEGRITEAKSRLRATVVLSHTHALTLGTTLLKQLKAPEADTVN